MATIPDNFRDLLGAPVIVGLVTILPSGQPQATPVWCDFDGTYIRVNTSKSRQKYTDMTERPQVTVLALDPKNPYRYLEVRGKVARITEDGALDHINKLAKEYTGADQYGNLQPGEVRVICSIEPQRVVAHG